MNKFIITGDWHLREDRPPCISNSVDWMALQKEKIDCLSAFAKNKEAMIIHTGDLFHRQSVPMSLLTFAINTLPNCMYVVPGNHDSKEIVGKSERSIVNSALSVLEAANKISIIDNHLIFDNVWVEHIPVFEKLPSWAIGDKFIFDIEGYVRNFVHPTVCDSGKKVGYVFTGDNHSFFYKEIYCDGITYHSINPGCMTIQRISENGYTPRFVYIETDNLNNTEIRNFPDLEVFDHEYLEREKNDDTNVNLLIESLSKDYDIGISFESNVKKFFYLNRVEPRVKEIVMEVTA